VAMEIPGMRPEDIEIDLENNVLTVSGEKQEERTEEKEGGTYHLSERRYGRFSRSFVLPRDVESEQIQARTGDGLLRITVPKSERSRRRRIEVRSGQAANRQVETRTGERQE
jgi:HSP20 family protein